MGSIKLPSWFPNDKMLHLIVFTMLFFVTWGIFKMAGSDNGLQWGLLITILGALGKEINDVSGAIKFLLTSNKRAFDFWDFIASIAIPLGIYIVHEMINYY